MPDDDPMAWEVTECEIAYACPGFEIIHEHVTLPDGTHTEFDYLTEPRSVVVLPFTATGEVVVIEEWREAVKRRNLGLPAGTAEPADEDLADTAGRELQEETGYRAGRLEPLAAFEPANGLADTVHHYYIAHGCDRDGDPDHDEDETIRVRVMPFDRLYEATLAGKLRDGRSAIALLYYRATRDSG